MEAKKIRKALGEEELEQVSGGRGRGANIQTCPYCGLPVSANDLNNHIYAVHTADAYQNGDK